MLRKIKSELIPVLFQIDNSTNYYDYCGEYDEVLLYDGSYYKIYDVKLDQH